MGICEITASGVHLQNGCAVEPAHPNPAYKVFIKIKIPRQERRQTPTTKNALAVHTPSPPASGLLGVNGDWLPHKDLDCLKTPKDLIN